MAIEQQPATRQGGAAGQPWTGQALKRFEDDRLIRGRGQYVEDTCPPGTLHVSIVRSPYAHARIVSIDAEEAKSAPGVVAVVTAADFEEIGSVPAALAGGAPVPEHPTFARDVVRFAGEPVAAVVAETLLQARDAADSVFVDYDPLPAVVDAVKALEDGAPIVHEALGTNEAYHTHHASGDVDAAFAAAKHKVTVKLRHGRVAAVPMETRGVLAWVAEDGRLTVSLATQAAWLERTDLAKALGMEESDLRVLTPDVGGAFGAKMTLYREDMLVAVLAKRLGRPVRWISTRMEDMFSSMHGREAYSEAEVAVDESGKMMGLRVRTVANLGAYAMKYGGGPPQRMLYFPTGTYTVTALDADVRGAFTNTTPMGPYRGAGRPEAAFFAERMADEVANALGMDPAEVRRRNFIPPEAFPYKTAGGQNYDSGNYAATMDRALEVADYAGLRKLQAERRAEGKVFGIGIASTVEISGGGGENGRVSVDPSGQIVATTGTSPHGQGLQTAFAQVVADQLGVHPSEVTVAYGDTDTLAKGGGTLGSRSGTLGGNSLSLAAIETRAKLAEAAAGLLEASASDLVFSGGQISVAGAPDRSISLGEAANKASGGGALTLDASFSNQGGDTFPFGTAVTAVSIDRDTGKVKIERFVAVHDNGNVINPTLVEGQLYGGIAQGIGEALYEGVAYDEDGQLIASTLTEYAVPISTYIPPMQLDRTVTPSPRNPLGMKGVGESGTVTAPPAVVNAVVDALRPFGDLEVDLPLTSEKIWRILRQAAP